jgi:histone acetyltransferase (RNA polymerase elongator complex component)
MLKAEEICRQNKVTKLAVISGVGVRDYYRHQGYRLEKGLAGHSPQGGGWYMVKKLAS